MMTTPHSLPTGTVTFLFTDIEGSTRLWEQNPEAMKAALAKHDSILREAIGSNHGNVIKTTGDGFHAAFATALDGVNATINAQREFHSSFLVHPSSFALKVRMGLHTGEAELREGDYYGGASNRAARIMSLAQGGQILLSGVAAEVVREHLPEGASLLNLGEHRLKDLTRPEHVFQLEAAGLPTDFPALKSLDAFPNNLPIQLTSFIGRERELMEAKKRFNSARLLTLIGPGGTGKTRLSLQLGADLLPSFADGVWLAEFAPLADPALLLQTVASLFGLREQMGLSLHDIVADFLRAKKLVLILDNCEHVIDASAQLADSILHACPQVRIIASSREALGIAGETVYRVPSLSLPDPAQATREALSASESAQLFIERAAAANPKFELTENNAAAVAQICRRLDGIPLALELAAARVTMFSPEQIATRLDDRFKLLTGGSRTALPRQQTLRALIDWSYDMLTEAERKLIRRFSVFAGGWSYEAAEVICTELDVLNLLTQLVNKSMVTVEDESGLQRYRLLETVRQYARDKLLETGESEMMRDAHLKYFLAFVEQEGPKVDGETALAAILRIEAEYDNIRAALEWGLAQNLNAALRMIWLLASFWIRRGGELEGGRWTKDALARTDSLPARAGEEGRELTRLRAYALQALSMVNYSHGDNARAIKVSEQVASLGRELGDDALLGMALAFEASARLFVGDIDSIDGILEESMDAARRSGNNFALGMTLNMIAQRKHMLGSDPREAKELFEEGLKILKESGNRWGYTMALFGSGMMARFQMNFPEARLRFVACEPLFRELGDMHRVNMIKSELGHIERYEGRHQNAEKIYRETILEWKRMGHRAAIAHQLECFGSLAKISERGERATTLFGSAEALREQIGIAMTVMERVEYEVEIADLRAGMDEAAFKSAWVAGRAHSMEDAIKFALQ